jgi:DNA repair exonuclease SbcCD nuclease subunit
MRFDKVYTGHFHSQQQVGENVFYPGSPIPFKFDEGNTPHGFLVYDTVADDHTFVDLWEIAQDTLPGEVPPPQYHTILDEQIDELVHDDVANNMIRISLSREYTPNEKAEIKSRLIEMGARTVRWMDITNKSKLAVKPVVAHAENTNLFQNWLEVDTKNIKNLDKNMLLSTHGEVILAGDEMYLAENPNMLDETMDIIKNLLNKKDEN